MAAHEVTSPVSAVAREQVSQSQENSGENFDQHSSLSAAGVASETERKSTASFARAWPAYPEQRLIFAVAAAGLGILLAIGAIILVPDMGMFGRIGCVLLAAMSPLIGYALMHAHAPDGKMTKVESETPAASEDVDHRIEQLEDAKWALSERAAHYRDLLDQHQDMIIRRDGTGDLTFANQAFCKTFGRGDSNILSDSSQLTRFGQINVPDIAKSDGRTIVHSDGLCIRMTTNDGERWIEWDLREIETDKDVEVQFTGRDITDVVDAHRALQEAKDQAQSASRAKSRFLASMSHEIRTPMNGILGMANLLLDERLTDQQKSYVNAVELSARNLLAIIDEILDFSKIEAGKITLSERYFSISDTVMSVVELLAPGAQDRGLEIAWTVDQTAGGEFVGDAARVRQILLNLVSNAVKFTDTGGVRVAVSGREKSLTNGSLETEIEIRVSDTGVGLTPAEQQTLFSEFVQTDQALKRQQGGTGLGLAISKRLAEAMHGSLHVESNVGHGSTFVAKLHLAPAFGARQCHTFAALNETLKLKVLLAFDRLLERAALAEMLSEAGIAVVECGLEDAEDAVRLAAQNGHPFTRLIVDAECDPDRAEAALDLTRLESVRHGFDKNSVRGIVLVNMASRSQLKLFEPRGFGAYLVRPVRPKTVFEQVIADCQNEPRKDASATALQNAAPGLYPEENLRFLLVEDNDINAVLVEHQLQRLGHQVERLCTGREAVDTIRAVAAGEAPAFDVILMDVLLPEMDGLEATAEIKSIYRDQQKAAEQPPIIALTANAFEEDRQTCLEAGMTDYLAKPFDQGMLNAVLERCRPRARS